MHVFEKLKNGINRYGFSGMLQRIPGFIQSRIKKILNNPTYFSRFGISEKRWVKFQINHELNFWNDPSRYHALGEFKNIREKFFYLNKKRFKEIRLDFADKIVADIGCGPLGGFLPFVTAKIKIGVDPLSDAYAEKYSFDKDIIMLSSIAEKIPILSNTLDACYCINMLDHAMKPKIVLTEIHRILKKGGYLALAVDTGGTKGHPIKIYKQDLDDFFNKHPFRIIEQQCSPEKSTWGPEAGIPLYTFQGYKL